MWDFATDPLLDRQRIRFRLKIPRGTFAYDVTGLLGSRLYAAQRLSVERALTEIPLIIREALEPMDDIDVRDIAIEQDEVDPGKMIVQLKYGHVLDLAETELSTDETEEFFVTIAL